MTGSRPIAFDRYVLDMADARLTGPNGPIAVGDKALRVLAALLDARGRLVTKDELFDAAWPGITVTESTLTTVVKELRRALDDPARKPRFIESVYGKGYRFLVPASAGERLEVPAAAATGNLPHASNPLIGRDAELALLDERLRQPALVSLVGPGGAGKTSLALEVARRAAARFRDGAWLVELSPVREGADVALATAAAMRVTLPVGREPRDALVDAVRRREALVVLDNAEHLIDAVAELVRALRGGAPDVTVLVTSRESLGQPGELIVPLGPLAPEAAQDLFTARAVAADPGFARRTDQRQPIAAICARLDHLPLAIEMAAARAPLLGCDAVLQRLEATFAARFALLTSGPRASEPRQRTLRGTIEWSHALLGEEEAAAFRRLAVFPGSFPVDAAAAVAALGQEADFDPFGAIASLVAKSLLVAQPGEDGMRYRMLETMRAFALERLDAAAETEAAWRAMADWLLALTGPFLPDYFATMSDRVVAGRYMVERDSLAAAIDWLAGPGGRVDMAAELFCNCWNLWSEYSVRRTLFRLLERIGPDVSPVLRARLLRAEAHSAMWFSPNEAVAKADEALAAIRAAGPAAGDGDWPMLDVLCSKGHALCQLDRVDEVEAVCAELAPLVPAVTTSRISAHVQALRARLAFTRGGAAAARPIFAEIERALRGFGAEIWANFWKIQMLNLDTDRPLDARIEAWREAIASIQTGPPASEALLFNSSLDFVLLLGTRGLPDDLAEARTLLARCFRRGGIPRDHRLYLAMAMVAALSGQPDDAARLFGVADARRRRSGENALTREGFDHVRALVERSLAPDQAKWLIGEGEALARGGEVGTFIERFRSVI